MRLFEILDQMNQDDAKNNTQNVSICPDVVSINSNTNRGTVTMGVPGSLGLELAAKGDAKAILLVVVDRKAYEAIKNA